MSERWLPVPGYEGLYEVSDRGLIRSVKRSPRPLSPTPSGKGYMKVTLSRDGVRWDTYVHRLVLTAFVGPCPEGHEACHQDGVPANNALSNLRWGTSSDNNLDTVRVGRHHNAVKTACPQGHEYTPGNTMILPEGSRACRRCRRFRSREYKARKRAEHLAKPNT